MGLVGLAEAPVYLIAVETNGPHQLGSIGQVPFGNESLLDSPYLFAVQERLWKCQSTLKLRNVSNFRLL
jgi:hypothetical protein